MPPPLVPSNAYYLISSNRYGSGVFLADGSGVDGKNGESSPGALSLTSYSFSSENWQIFYQEPVYLIRNFDYKAEYQLGIPKDSPTQPGLLPASGDLMQQWNITLWDDGTYRLTNVGLGDVQVLGVGLKDDQPIPVMNAAQNGSHWSFDPNPSDATTNVTDGMLQPVSLQVVRCNHDSACALLVDVDSDSQAFSPTSTLSPHSTSGSTAISSTPAETTVDVTNSIAGSVQSSSSSTSTSSQSTASRSLSGGVIAGIVVAIVAAALVIVGLVFFLRRKKRRQRQLRSVNQTAFAQQDEKALPTLLHEADTRHAPVEMGTSNERGQM